MCWRPTTSLKRSGSTCLSRPCRSGVWKRRSRTRSAPNWSTSGARNAADDVPVAWPRMARRQSSTMTTCSSGWRRSASASARTMPASCFAVPRYSDTRVMRRLACRMPCCRRSKSGHNGEWHESTSDESKRESDLEALPAACRKSLMALGSTGSVSRPGGSTAAPAGRPAGRTRAGLARRSPGRARSRCPLLRPQLWRTGSSPPARSTTSAL